MNLPGPIAVKAANDAVSNIGVREEGRNDGKYIRVYQKSVGLNPGDPWCAAFVYYRLQKAASVLGLPLPEHVPCSGWTPDWAKWGKNRGMWMDAKWRPGGVQKGDLALFYMPHMGRIAHIGIVIGRWKDGVVTVEGNTNDAGGRDGDGVYRKERTWKEFGEYGGFVRCDF